MAETATVEGRSYFLGFHAKEGLYFQHDDDGNVTIVATVGDSVVKEVTLDAATWASVVASVCKRGENSTSFREALNYHERG